MPLTLAASNDATGSATKGDIGITDTGQLSIADAITGTLEYGGDSGVYSGTHGTLTIDATGNWHYTLTSDANALNTANGGSLNHGDTLTDTIAVTITDGGIRASGASVTFDLTITINGRDEVTGTNGRDTLTGTANDDIIQGGDERDVITTGGGNDLVIGGYGDDTITLGAGAETVIYRYASGTIRGLMMAAISSMILSWGSIPCIWSILIRLPMPAPRNF